MTSATQPSKVRLGTWNTQWAVPGSARGGRVSASLADPGCDVLCVTEGSAGLLPGEGHIIDAGTDWGYSLPREGRRKVVLWSRSPWTEVDSLGSEDLPGGRFVKGVTKIACGPLAVVGVCIPWDGAHVGTGRKDRRRWQDHQRWLEAFAGLPYRSAARRTVVLGDFNQRIPRARTPQRIHQALLRAFEGLEIGTAGDLPGARGRAIDHIAHTQDLKRTGPIGIWPERNDRNEPMSDHFGVWADFSLSDRQDSLLRRPGRVSRPGRVKQPVVKPRRPSSPGGGSAGDPSRPNNR